MAEIQSENLQEITNVNVEHKVDKETNETRYSIDDDVQIGEIQEKTTANAESTKVEIIKPINRETVHRICSGQVVLSLAIAVKELVENALDAGATNIEIRLKEYGSELVEVIDNGSGVPKENFAALTLKHYTSKLREFSDLESVGTLGFRGEALSSLCALSDVTITTRHSTVEHATKIKYDHGGKIISETPTARPEGTTISLSNLFSTLPVRRKEFMKNVKREFNKMCQLLYAYCLVSTGIKISCTNLNSKGAKLTVVTTQGLNTVRDNIISVFGSKQISSLIDIEATEPDDDILQQFGVKTTPGGASPFKFDCFVSSVTHGSGRSSSDRQFYYINSRPCEPAKIMKVVNETYKQFNFHQYPFIYLNIKIEKRHVDVNVTPDKRQIFLEKEKLLLATIKTSLLDAFKTFLATLSLRNVSKSETQTTLNETLKGLKRSLSKRENESTKVPLFESFKKKSKRDVEEQKNTLVMSSNLPSHNKSLDMKVANATEDVCVTVQNVKVEDVCDPNKSLDIKQEHVASVTNDSIKDKTQMQFDPNKTLDVLLSVACKLVKEDRSEMVVDVCDIERKESCEKQIDRKTKVTNPKRVILKTSLVEIEDRIKCHMEEDVVNDVVIKFRSHITPDNNKQAEQELQKQITKEKFKEMEVIGQFNLGFIVTRLDDDLFIIDQHATDEKYNFEQLQLNTTLESQVLVTPKPLQLTAASESLLIENEEVFRKNGFTFVIDHTAEATKKIKMKAVPRSKNVIFGKDDIDELLFMLQDASHTMCRPSRVQSMFASRACRKSVMVGKPLTCADMRRLVDHMGDIDQPWNCPHGRPTMRHLINLNLVNKE